MKIDDITLNHYMKKLSSVQVTNEKGKENEKGKGELHISSQMSKMLDKKARTNYSKLIRKSDVYHLLQQVPAGKVSTYGDLARALGNPSASRAIGRILGENPNPIKVPCHRIVMSNGRVGGYAYGGTTKKKQLLEKEGLLFTKGTVRGFKNFRVYPKSSKDRD